MAVAVDVLQQEVLSPTALVPILDIGVTRAGQTVGVVVPGFGPGLPGTVTQIDREASPVRTGSHNVQKSILVDVPQVQIFRAHENIYIYISLLAFLQSG